MRAPRCLSVRQFAVAFCKSGFLDPLLQESSGALLMKERLLTIVRWIRKFIREKFHSDNDELPYYVTILISAILFVVALNGFVEITDELAENELTGLDKSVTE